MVPLKRIIKYILLTIPFKNPQYDFIYVPAFREKLVTLVK